MLFACFGGKTSDLAPKPKPYLVVLTKMGFLTTPPTNQKQTVTYWCGRGLVFCEKSKGGTLWLFSSVCYLGVKTDEMKLLKFFNYDGSEATRTDFGRE